MNDMYRNFGPGEKDEDDEPEIVTTPPQAGSGEDISPYPDYTDIIYPDPPDDDD